MDRADTARRLLSEPFLLEAFKEQRETYLREAMKCGEKDDLGRFRYLEAAKVVDGVMRHFEVALTQGKLGKKEQKEFKGRRWA